VGFSLWSGHFLFDLGYFSMWDFLFDLGIFSSMSNSLERVSLQLWILHINWQCWHHQLVCIWPIYSFFFLLKSFPFKTLNLKLGWTVRFPSPLCLVLKKKKKAEGLQIPIQ
jgi:hypothetical protein